MKKERVDRIRQLEKAIYGLRGMNHSNAVRKEDRENNFFHIIYLRISKFISVIMSLKFVRFKIIYVLIDK